MIPRQAVTEAGVQGGPAIGVRRATEVRYDWESVPGNLHVPSCVDAPWFRLGAQAINSLPIHLRQLLGSILWLDEQLRGSPLEYDLWVVCSGQAGFFLRV